MLEEQGSFGRQHLPRSGLRSGPLPSFKRMRNFMSKRRQSDERKTKVPMKVTDADDLEWRNRFETESMTMETLVESCKEYRDTLFTLVTSAAKVARQFSLFYGPDHPHRDIVDQLCKTSQDTHEAMALQLLEVFNTNVLSGPTKFLDECKQVGDTCQDRDEALELMQRLGQKHESNTVKSTSTEKTMYSGEKYKEASNSYAILNERALTGARTCHMKIDDVVDSSFLGMVFLQLEFHQIAHQQIASVAELYKPESTDDNVSAPGGDESNNDACLTPRHRGETSSIPSNPVHIKRGSMYSDPVDHETVFDDLAEFCTLTVTPSSGKDECTSTDEGRDEQDNSADVSVYSTRRGRHESNRGPLSRQVGAIKYLSYLSSGGSQRASTHGNSRAASPLVLTKADSDLSQSSISNSARIYQG